MDIDIDLPTNFDPLDYFDVVRASMVKSGNLVKHPVGVYFQEIAKDRISGFAAIPYEQAEEMGYFKIDFLHLAILNNFENKNQIRALLKVEPDWSLLLQRNVVAKLFQIHKHYDILFRIQPTSIIELADTIALIRPAKRNLIDAYVENKEEVRKLLYTKPDDGQYYFKKSHAIAYAMTIVLQLHLIKGNIL